MMVVIFGRKGALSFHDDGWCGVNAIPYCYLSTSTTFTVVDPSLLLLLTSYCSDDDDDDGDVAVCW